MHLLYVAGHAAHNKQQQHPSPHNANHHTHTTVPVSIQLRDSVRVPADGAEAEEEAITLLLAGQCCSTPGPAGPPATCHQQVLEAAATERQVACNDGSHSSSSGGIAV
jgi:hypothetical protein